MKNKIVMERVRTMTIARWNSSDDVDDEEHQGFFASCSSSSDDDAEFDDCRLSFASAVSSSNSFSSTDLYDVWIATPTSISERRKRLLQGMGLAMESRLSKVTAAEPPNCIAAEMPSPSPSPRTPSVRRSRSDGDMAIRLGAESQRVAEMVGTKQRVSRTCSDSAATAKESGGSLMSEAAARSLFLIKNLDTGKEFVVKECGEDGAWNRLSDLQTGKQLTMEEFEKCVGHSPVVKELMRRHHMAGTGAGATSISGRRKKSYAVNANSILYKSLRQSKRRGVALLKSGIKGVAHSVSGLIYQQDHGVVPTEWIKARQSGKYEKELTAVHLCQEIPAHRGSVWTLRFSVDGRFLASAGEDRAVHVWEVEECHVSEDAAVDHHHHGHSPVSNIIKKSTSTPDYVHVPSTVFGLSQHPVSTFTGHSDQVLDLSWSTSQLLLSSSMDKTVRLWDMETKSCLKLFSHNDYVTCIHFNPMDDEYFISGSLDGKVRIWSIPDRQVVDWTDFHEMVTAASYTPDGQGAFIGSHKGNIRVYSTQDCKLSQTAQIDLRNKKKSQAKKITGFQFSPTNSNEVVVTSADSRVRILDGQNIVHKFKGFRNTSSQIAASFSEDGKYVISASEDSQVYVWRREEQSQRHNSSNSNSKRCVINTTSFEHFHCSDVSIAVPWTARGSTHSSVAAAWGLVVVTAGLRGHIRAYQNFGLPRKVGRQTSLFS